MPYAAGVDVSTALMAGAWTLLLVVLGIILVALGSRWNQRWMVVTGAVTAALGVGWFLAVFYLNMWM